MKIGIVLALTVILPSVHAADLDFTASVDRTQLSLSETFTLTLQIQGSVASVPSPKLPDLSGFRILSGPNESSTFQFINGRYSYTKTLTFVLKPEKEGTLTIGPAELTHGGKIYRTEPITLQVGAGGNPPVGKFVPTVPEPQKKVAPGEPPEVFVQVSADKTQAYQNEQIVLTYTIYTRVSVNAYEISKLPSTPGFWTEEFQLPPQPEVRDVVFSGRHYRAAVVRRVALFPTRSGELVVDPLEITCQVQMEDRQRRTRDPFDMLFDSPFMRYRTEERYIQTDPLTLKVTPLPQEGRPANFSGAVGNFNLAVSLDRQQVKTNEALSMSVRFRGTGNVKMLPQPDFKAPPDFESYDPKQSIQVDKTGDRISGSKAYEYVLIPRFAGQQRIPPITFNYFDPAAKSYRTLTKGGFDIDVQPGSATPVVSATGISKEDVKLLGEDVHYLKSPGRLLPVGSINYLPSGYWVGMALPPVIAILLWAGARLLGAPSLQTRRQARKTYAKAQKELKTLAKSSGSKPGSDDQITGFYGGLYRIVLSYLGKRLNSSAMGLKEEEILELLSKRRVPQSVLNEIQQILQVCNLARFAPEREHAASIDRVLRRSRLALEKLEEHWGRSR